MTLQLISGQPTRSWSPVGFLICWRELEWPFHSCLFVFLTFSSSLLFLVFVNVFASVFLCPVFLCSVLVFYFGGIFSLEIFILLFIYFLNPTRQDLTLNAMVDWFIALKGFLCWVAWSQTFFNLGHDKFVNARNRVVGKILMICIFLYLYHQNS